MPIFYLLRIPVFIVVAIGIIMVGKFLFKVADSLEVDEKIGDIKHQAELAEDVEKFIDGNEDTLKKSSSTTVKDFI